MALALLVLVLADDSLVDDWPLAPTVYLSIIATLANAMIRFAFSESADLFWWSRLLSESGTTLSELHTIWDLKHNAFSLVNLYKQQKQKQKQKHLYFRLTSLLVLLLAINGPLLQRAITVNLATRIHTHDGVKLPIRREPMWNFTTKTLSAQSPLQDELAEVYIELNQGRAPILPYAVCSPNSTCSANVTVAGFTRTCTESKISVDNAPSIVDIPAASSLNDDNCTFTGSNSSCREVETCYQLALDDAWDNLRDDTLRPGDGGMPWVNGTLRPSLFYYDSYVRYTSKLELLSVHNCTISTSFVELSILITEEKVVTLLPAITSSNDGRTYDSTHGVESIPMPFTTPQDDTFPLGEGIMQIMDTLYGGYILSYDRSAMAEITGPQQYINHSSVLLQRRPDGSYTTQFSCTSPIADFYTTLDEVSFRYALKSISSEPQRVAQHELLWTMRSYEDADIRHEIIPLMDTEFVKEQVVDGFREERTVAVYSAHYAYTGIAMGVTYAATFFVALLLRGVFSSHGRQFSMSPLEIAKAFNAPLLKNLGSNSRGSDLAKEAPTHRVKYGEADAKADLLCLPHNGVDGDSGRLPTAASGGRDASQREDAPALTDVLLEEAGEQTRLMIDAAERVKQPSNRRLYT